MTKPSYRVSIQQDSDCSLEETQNNNINNNKATSLTQQPGKRNTVGNNNVTIASPSPVKSPKKRAKGRGAS